MAEKTVEMGSALDWGWIVFGRDRAIGYTSKVDIEDVKRCLHADAAAELPAGSRYQLRRAVPWNYGRSHSMAWYHNNLMAEAPTWGDTTEKVHDPAGFYSYGQFTTPQAPQDGG